MREFILTDEGLLDKIEAAERAIIRKACFLGGVSIVGLLLLLRQFNWPILLLGLGVVWGIIEWLTWRLRSRLVDEWVDFKVSYEHSSIRQFKNGEWSAEILRNKIQYIYESHNGLEVKDLETVILIPKEIVGYDEIEDELQSWRSFSINPKGVFNPKPAPPPIQPKPTYQQTRMREVRQARRHRKLKSLLSFKWGKD